MKLKNTHCEFYKKDSKFKHFEEAVIACRKKPQCMAVYDQYCSNKDFHLCDNGLVKQSTLGSCVYIIGKCLYGTPNQCDKTIELEAIIFKALISHLHF